jgi:hypothetical protein
MLRTRERQPAFRTIEGWARNVLLEARAIRECEEHGWMVDRTDPHAHERAFDIARQDPPPGVSPQERLSRLQKFWTLLATAARNARPNSS